MGKHLIYRSERHKTVFFNFIFCVPLFSFKITKYFAGDKTLCADNEERKAEQPTHNIRKAELEKRFLFSCFQCSQKTRGRPAPKGNPSRINPVVIHGDGLEEEFGVRLVTYELRRRDGSPYFRHFLDSVEHNGPAGEMLLENNDELLLINADFVQPNSHEEVLKLFGSIKIDGRTRFDLVIRRCHKKRLRKIWSWIDTSAILTPGSKSHAAFDDHPAAEDIEYKKVENNKVEIKTKHRYKISGTQLYLDIRNKNVTADVCTGTEKDETKIICKRQRYWQDDEGLVHFEAALCDENLENYIAYGPDNKIMIKSEPTWFDQTERGSSVLFRFKDKYLAYNIEQDQVDAQASEFSFEEFPGDVDFETIIPRDVQSEGNLAPDGEPHDVILEDIEKNIHGVDVVEENQWQTIDLKRSITRVTVESEATASKSDRSSQFYRNWIFKRSIFQGRKASLSESCSSGYQSSTASVNKNAYLSMYTTRETSV